MSEKPQKRLVSKGRYAWLMAGRTTLLSGCALCSLAGVYLAFLTVILLCLGMGAGWQGRGSVAVWALLILFALLTGGAFLLAFYLFKRERKVARVAPITRHTTGSLSPKESLVRASDAPASQQQAELLRAAQYGKETPAEELLRATTRNSQEE